jgi:hypothetical protein
VHGPMTYVVNEHLRLTFWALPGEGSLSDVTVQHASASRAGGNYCAELGLGRPFKGIALEIRATLVRKHAETHRASVTYVLYQSFPDRPDSPDNRVSERHYGPFNVVFDGEEHSRPLAHTIELM